MIFSILLITLSAALTFVTYNTQCLVIVQYEEQSVFTLCCLYRCMREKERIKIYREFLLNQINTNEKLNLMIKIKKILNEGHKLKIEF